MEARIQTLLKRYGLALTLIGTIGLGWLHAVSFNPIAFLMAFALPAGCVSLISYLMNRSAINTQQAG